MESKIQVIKSAALELTISVGRGTTVHCTCTPNPPDQAIPSSARPGLLLIRREAGPLHTSFPPFFLVQSFSQST